MNAADNSHHLKLELDAEPNAIHGTIERGDGTREAFWGWLELMAALAHATATPPNSRITASVMHNRIGRPGFEPLAAR